MGLPKRLLAAGLVAILACCVAASEDFDALQAEGRQLLQDGAASADPELKAVLVSHTPPSGSGTMRVPGR